MTDLSDREEPVIGQNFQNLGIVKSITETVNETSSAGASPRPNMRHSQKIVKLESGMILTIDHYIEKGKGEKKSSGRGGTATSGVSKKDANKKKNSSKSSVSSDESSKSSTTSKSSATQPTSKKAKGTKASKKKEKAPPSPTISATNTTTTNTTTTADEQREELNQIESRMSQKKGSKEGFSKERRPEDLPLASIMVYNSKDPDLPPQTRSLDEDDLPSTGVWVMSDSYGSYGVLDDEEDQDEDLASNYWKPQEVVLFGPDASLDTILEEEENSLPSGIWGYRARSTGTLSSDPDSPTQDKDRHTARLPTASKNRFLAGADNDDTPQHAMVVPPKMPAPNDFVQAGIYTYKPGTLHRQWPPPADHVRRRLAEVGKLKIPNCFEEKGGIYPVKVFPANKLPRNEPDDDDDDDDDDGRSSSNANRTPVPMENKKSKGVSFAPEIAQWAYPNGKEESDDHLMPVDIDLFWGDKIPPTSNGDDTSMDSFGVWGSQDSVLDIGDPDWKPEMSMVFPPGMEPDPEISIQGRWAYRMNQNIDLNVWPPIVAKTAVVFSSKDAPATLRGVTQGVWRFTDEDAVDQANEESWEPAEVELIGDHVPIDKDEQGPNGLWGIRKGAPPDKNWDWNPNDVNFFPPNQSPDETTWVQGRWLRKREVGKLKSNWPPATRRSPSVRKVGKLNRSKWPHDITVYPMQGLPATKTKARNLGVWKFSEGKEEPKDARRWTPQQVELLGEDGEIDTKLPFGIWGIRSDAKVLEDQDAHIKPKELWFYPPGHQPDPACAVQGKWAFQKHKLDVSWPPSAPISPVRKTSPRTVGKLKLSPPAMSPSLTSPQRRVGKLKIPGAFEEKGGSPSSSTGDARKKLGVPSLFTNFN